MPFLRRSLARPSASSPLPQPSRKKQQAFAVSGLADRRPNCHGCAADRYAFATRRTATGPDPSIVPGRLNVTNSRLRTYKSCPRRFFYTHVLGLGGARKTTAFSQTHDCLYRMIDWLAVARADGAPGHAEAVVEFERVWAERGPITHGFAADYKHLADRLIKALVDLGAGRKFRASESLAIDLAGGRLIVEPDEMAELPNGTVILRRVRTGYRREKEEDELDYTLYHLAGREHYGSAYAVEAIHLTDEIVEPVPVSPTKLKNRQTKAAAMLRDIAAGWFLPKPDDFRCPRCPHFFVCDAVGRGPLSLI